MAYERLDEALRQLKTDRERREATESRRRKASAEARIQFAQIKSAVIGPIFNEVVARLAAEGFFGETIVEKNDLSGPITLNVNLSEDEGIDRQGSFQVRFDPDRNTCTFGQSTMGKAASTNQVVFDDIEHLCDEITEKLVSNKVELFFINLISGKFSHWR
jgi:hypothetical protein